MSKAWEFTTTDEMLNYLVGPSYGVDPLNKLAEIRAEKESIGATMVAWLELTKSDDVLEIGSGCGFISRFIAPQVRHLYCCDISQSFLDLAKKECASMDNVSFEKIESGRLPFLKDASLAAAYSYNVFIHLNIFDIYLYLRELQRVLKPRGTVWFDIAMADNFENEVPQIFLDMAAEYAEKPESYLGLMKWNSKEIVISLAKSCGFTLCPRRRDDQSFVFIKN